MKSIFLKTEDNATLHVATWGTDINKSPVICLPGLTRNHMDFAALASELNRPVYAFDYRGRGLSSHNATLADYSFMQEQADLRFAFHQLGLKHAIFVGTSRGGLHTMMLTDMVVASVINDIGPEIELKGLLKIKASLSKRGVAPLNYAEGVALLKTLLQDEFTDTDETSWLTLAHGIWVEQNGLHLSYDEKLKGLLDAVTEDTEMPPNWVSFATLAEKPCFILRGENSQLLSSETFEKMVNYNEMTSGVVIKGQGHAPIMCGDVNEEIVRFIKTLS
jgi:hypothetical protein